MNKSTLSSLHSTTYIITSNYLNFSVSLIFTTDLQATTLALDFRVTILEENGGSDGNSSVAELEVRVETLEGTAADHENKDFCC